ncbi:MAG: SIR2 family protein [Candidatus Nitrosopolaris sp.]
MDIFSTNYDVCIEQFCKLNNKECVNGFNPKWDPEVVFNNPHMDVRLYKLHGSVTWYRTEQGEYESSNILIKDMKVELATRQEAIPFIVYPGKKLQYNEPTIDILVELKRQLKDVKYVFVIGYSFKDEHISKIFRYAARINPEFVLFLISPSVHDIYYFTLKHHIDDEFLHSFTHESSSPLGINTERVSDLEGRVIRLPYRLEKIVHLLKDKYFDNLRNGQHCEKQREIELDNLPDKQLAVSRWSDCLRPYIECEYIDKVEKIIEEKIGWDELLINRDYKLGCEIIVKSLLNILPFEAERIKWLNRLKKYIPLSPENLEVKIEAEKVFPLFRLSGQSPLYGDDALNFYKSLRDIYKNHPIFFNDEELKLIENGEEIIKQACNYLDVWKNTTLSLDDYIIIRKEKYAREVSEILLHNNSSHSDKLTQTLTEIERKEIRLCKND